MIKIFDTFILICFLFLCAPVKAQIEADCPAPLIVSPNVAPFNGKKICPIVGRLNNTKLAIPQHYLLGPVAYKNFDIWNPGLSAMRSRSPTFESEIDNFSIKIRLSDFTPIESNEDLLDYEKLGNLNGWNQPPNNRWIHIGFEYFSVSEKRYTKQSTLSNWLKDDAKQGPFVKISPIFDLEHFVSKKSPSKNVEQYELYYDSRTEDTFIYCQNKLLAVAPFTPLSFCKIDFLVRDLSLSVHISNIYHKDDIAKWRDIESKVRLIFESFIVN